MISTEQMMRFASAEGSPGPFSCAEAVAASLPLEAKLRAAMVTFKAAPARHKSLAIRRPLLAAKLIARGLKCSSVPAEPTGSPAWGIVDGGNGELSFAVCDGRLWWARSRRGISRVHPSWVLAAWEVV